MKNLEAKQKLDYDITSARAGATLKLTLKQYEMPKRGGR
jgi:hypothetical protein